MAWNKGLHMEEGISPWVCYLGFRMEKETGEEFSYGSHEGGALATATKAAMKAGQQTQESSTAHDGGTMTEVGRSSVVTTSCSSHTLVKLPSQNFNSCMTEKKIVGWRHECMVAPIESPNSSLPIMASDTFSCEPPWLCNREVHHIREEWWSRKEIRSTLLPNRSGPRL